MHLIQTQLDPPAEQPGSLLASKRSGLGDTIFRRVTLVFGLIVALLIIWIGFELYRESSITRGMFGLSILKSSAWDVQHNQFGALPFIFGTLVTSALALILAVPIGIGAALFLTEIAPRWIATPVSFVIELIAAVPSVIFGLWGFQVVCPFLQEHVNPWLVARFGALPLFAGPAYLTNMLAAGLILAIMILPMITSVSREVIRAVPAAQREAALGMGATKWETVRSVVLKGAKSGIVGAVMLALGRAIGETMAVVMVIGNNPHISQSLLHPGYTMPSLLANEFNEAANEPIQRSALLEIAFILFIITLAINASARLLILWSNRSAGGGGSRSEKFANAAQVVSRWGFRTIIGSAALFQIISDISSHGITGLLGPVELLVVLFGLSRWITHISRKSPILWNRWRNFNHNAMYLLFSGFAALACLLLFALVTYVAVQGFRALNPNFFLNDGSRPPDDPTGGMKNGIIGTLMLVGIASSIGIPIGLMGGIFVSEFGRGKFGGFIRFAADVLNGIPSVVIGMFAYAAFVLPVGHFSMLAGGAALGIMMVPTILRTTEEMLKMVPFNLREASLGLGATKSRTILSIVLPAARGGIVTGIMLSVARIAGETAPLLFTAFGNQFVSTKLNEPVSSMTMMIYRFSTSAYPVWIDLAWAGALVLLIMVLAISLAARFITRNRYALR